MTHSRIRVDLVDLAIGVQAASRAHASSSQALWVRLSYLEDRIAAIETALNLTPPAPPRQVAEDPVAALEQMSGPAETLADPLESYDPTLDTPADVPAPAARIIAPAAPLTPDPPPAPITSVAAVSDPWPAPAPIDLPPGVDLGETKSNHPVDTPREKT